MNSKDSLTKFGKTSFSEAEVGEVVDCLYDRMGNCRIFAFSGPLGAGKTTIIRSLLRKAGVYEPITSPTFTYVNHYRNEKGQKFYHFDLYRMESVADFLDAGFEEYFFEPNSWCFIEWPEIIYSLLPEQACCVILDYHNEKRTIALRQGCEKK